MRGIMVDDEGTIDNVHAAGSSHLSGAINHYLTRPSCGPLWICDSKECEEEHIKRGPHEGRIRGV